MQNCFDWDWGMVALLNPDYAKKYLRNPFDEGYVPQNDNVLGLRLITPLGDTTVTDNEIRGMDINNYSEEELNIIKDMMREDTKIETDDTPNINEEGNLIEGVVLDCDTKVDADAKSLKTHMKHESEIRKEKIRIAAYDLKPEYKKQPLVSTKGYVALPPPVSVLSASSKYRFRYNAIKTLQIIKHSDFLPYQLIEELYEGIIENNDKIILYKHVHIKNRLTMAYRTITNNSGFERLIFNKKTGSLYHVRKVKKNKPPATKKSSARYKTVVMQYTVSLITFTPMIHNTFFNLFIEKIINAVLNKMPDALIIFGSKHERKMPAKSKFKIIIPKEQLDMASIGTTLFGLIIQFKLGKKVPWLTDVNFLNNLADHRRLKDKNGESLIKNGIIEYLRKNISTKHLLKKLYGNDFENMFIKLWSYPNAADIIHRYLFYIKYNDPEWYNEIKYYISVAINKNKFEYVRHIGFMAFQTNEINGDLTIRYRRYARAYLKYIYNRGFPDAIPTWTMFVDILDMAHRNNFGRIRLSHITNTQELESLHDKLVKIQNRDRNVLNELCQYKFLPFKLPDKEYSGFKFIQLMNVQELVNEGTSMKHCVGGYGHRCLTGDSIIISMFKERSWCTIELGGTDYGIIQKYSIGDNVVHNKTALDIINRWHSDVLKLHVTEDNIYKVLAEEDFKRQQDEVKMRLYAENQEVLSNES